MLDWGALLNLCFFNAKKVGLQSVELKYLQKVLSHVPLKLVFVFSRKNTCSNRTGSLLQTISSPSIVTSDCCDMISEKILGTRDRK